MTSSQTHQRNREKTKINTIRNEKEEATTDNAEIQRIIKDYYQEQLCAPKMDKMQEMDTLLQKYNLPRLNQEETENINRQITSTKTETVIKNWCVSMWQPGWGRSLGKNGNMYTYG